jgi:hypothetical protein
MSRKFFAVLAFVSVLTASLYAGKQHCRSGEVLAAELTSAKINVANLPPLAFPATPANKVYAVVSIRLNDLRALSIFDYTLNFSGVEFPCIALWRNNRFEYFTGDISGKQIQQMLFVIDSQYISGLNKLNISLKNKFSPANDQYNTQIPFVNIGTKMPTPPNKIPGTGLLEIPEE